MCRTRRGAYNNRITSWKLNKNFKASEKQAVIYSTKDPLLQPVSITTPSVPPHRLTRYANEHRKQARKTLKAKSHHSSELDISQSSHSYVLQSCQHVSNVTDSVNGQPDVFTNATFLYSPAERASELFFIRLKECIQVRYQVFIPHSQRPVPAVDDATLYNVPSAQLRLRDHLVLASEISVLRDTTSTHNWLVKACELAKSVLRQTHWRPLNLFATVYQLAAVDPKMGMFTARFLENMANTVYPNSQSCVVQLFRLFSQIEQPGSVLELAGQMSIDTVRELNPEDYRILSVMQSWVIDSYDVAKMYGSALCVAQQHKDFCSATFGAGHVRTRWAISKLVRAYLRYNDYINSYQEGVTLLRTYEENHIPIDDIYPAICTVLGQCCLRLEKTNAAVHYYSMYSHSSQQLYGTSGPGRNIGLDHLEWTQRMRGIG